MSSPSPVSQPTVNYTQELQQTLAGEQNTAPGFLALNQQYATPYTNINLQQLQNTLFGDNGQQGQLATQAQANQYTTGQNIGLINQYGLQGYNALMASNPGLAASLQQANAQGAASTAPGSVLSNMQNTANQQLALGGSLSPQQLSMVDQGTLSGFAQRGMLNGNQSLGADLLARDQYSQQLLGQRMGYAQTAQQATLGNNQYLSQLAGLNSSIYDPSQQILGRGSSVLGSLGGGSGGASALSGVQTAQGLFNPSAGNDAFMTNANAQYAANIANSNAQSAYTNSWIGAGGAIAGAALGAVII